MNVIRHKGTKVHVGCGGEVVRGVCLKCGEKQEGGLLKRLFGEGPLAVKEKDTQALERKVHRTRIRKGKDIFKE